MKKPFRLFLIIFIMSLLISIFSITILAVEPITPKDDNISIDINGLEDSTAESIKILFILTIISLAPSILIMMTSFTRIIIVLSCIRNAIGLQQTPPNQVLVGLALFLSLFIMNPVLNQINTEAYQPFEKGLITQEAAVEKALQPIRTFMLKQTGNDDLNLFLSLTDEERPETYDDIKTEILIPAFITSELKKAFTIGFLIYLPFLIIDMVVASTLMSMGMVMLPPVMISLPFKIMIFVVMNGWEMVIKTLILSFN
ncbi:MAG: flagellar biosynthetic protein FliP [Clostridia bacterium]|nr:flagellar biosynthetic protein FliP [Clostridia bacterium]